MHGDSVEELRPEGAANKEAKITESGVLQGKLYSCYI